MAGTGIDRHAQGIARWSVQHEAVDHPLVQTSSRDDRSHDRPVASIEPMVARAERERSDQSGRDDARRWLTREHLNRVALRTQRPQRRPRANHVLATTRRERDRLGVAAGPQRGAGSFRGDDPIAQREPSVDDHVRHADGFGHQPGTATG